MLELDVGDELIAGEDKLLEDEALLGIDELLGTDELLVDGPPSHAARLATIVAKQLFVNIFTGAPTLIV